MKMHIWKMWILSACRDDEEQRKKKKEKKNVYLEAEEPVSGWRENVME